MSDISRAIRHTIRHSQQRKKFAEGGVPNYDPMTGVEVGAPADNYDPQAKPSRASTKINRFVSRAFGEPRSQLWPEKMVRSGVSLAGDILSGNQKVLPPGLRREDYTDIPPPSAPTEDSTWLGRKLGLAPVAAQPNDEMMERAQDMAGLAGGQTLLTGARDATAVGKGAAHARSAAETGVDVGTGLAGPPGGAEGLREAQLAAQRRAGSRQPLQDLPQGVQIVDGQPFVPGPFSRAHEVADTYMQGKDFGVPHPDRYHPVDVEHATRIAQAFEDMPHAPNDPSVKSAYEALARETLDQYRAIIDHGGLKVTPVNAADYPYHGNPRAVAKDVADNNHMAFFKTREGFGTDYHADADHPLLKSSGEKVGDHDMLFNDLFRVVHDYFGHVKNGYGFRAAGEDNAWRAHAAMYSPEARRAMTTETRGQNSWLNYGPHGEKNRTANAADTIYAEQKIGLLPDWVMSDRLLSDSAAPGAPLAALEHAPKFYSGAERAVEAAPQPKMTGAQWIGTLANRGVKAEEMQWTGLGDFLLAKKDAPVTKAEVREHLGANKLELGEVHRSDSPWGDLPADQQRALADRWGMNPQEAAEHYGGLSASGHSPGTKFQDYQLPGGENYREKLLTLPRRDFTEAQALQEAKRFSASLGEDWNRVPADLQQRYIQGARETLIKNDRQNGSEVNYRSPHWDEPNVLVHRRSNEREVGGGGESFKLRNRTSGNTTKAFPSEEAALAHLQTLPEKLRPNLDVVPAGQMAKKALHIEEIQSDWHQQGRKKGYADNGKEWTAERTEYAPGIRGFQVRDGRGNKIADVSASSAEEAIASAKRTHSRQSAVPDAPFKKNWHELALKDAIREAAEKGLDRISWTPGEAQAARYDLSKDVKHVYLHNPVWHGENDIRGNLVATGHNGSDLVSKAVNSKTEIADLIGKEAADRLVNEPTRMEGRNHVLSGDGLKVGGEGMKGFYDKIIPDALNKIGKPHGVKVEKGELPSSFSIREYKTNGGQSRFSVEEKGSQIDVFSTRAAAERAISEMSGSAQPVHYMDIPQSLKDQALKKGFSLFEDTSMTGAPLAALMEQRKSKYYEGEPGTNAGVDAKPNRRIQTVADPHRMMFPGIYRDPKIIAQEAASRVGAEDPAMKQLFGVTRGDLREMAQGRVGNEEPNHPTFSDQSQYATGDQRARVGHWVGETFVPPALFAGGGDVEEPSVPTFDPAKLAALRAPPAFDPAKLAAVKKKEPDPMSAMDVASGAVENVPASAWQFAQDVVRPITHPVETLSGLKDLGLGLLEKTGAVGTILPPTGGDNTSHIKYADAMGQYLKNRYGGLENIKRSIAKDPVGVLSDASMVLTGGGSAAARLPGALGRAGEIAGNVGRAVDPLMAPVNAAKIGTKAVGELMTHTGATPLENAYRAGVEGGEAGDVFRGQMRGTSEMTEPVQMARQGLEGYRAARSKSYRTARDDITSLDRQMAPQDRILDFGKIDDAVDKARKVQTFGTRVLDKGANDVRNSMISEINEWKALDPVEYHTIDGLDALKRSLGHMMMDTQPGTSARKAAGDIYNAVKKTIVDYDPKYAKVMRDYEQASTQIRELERAMSLGEKASADTALRKLQSIMRNNVNTNYGRRLELGKLLEENGAKHLMAALSGQALNAWAPRGLGKLGAELGILAGAGHFISPWTLAATPLMSPRLMGEVSHAVGRTFGRGLNATNRALSGVGGNRTAGNISYRLGRTGNPDENATNPYAP